MASRKFFTRAQEARFRKFIAIASHSEDCTCSNKECIELRKYMKAWRLKTQPMRDAIRESERITAADLAIVINARAH